MPQYDFDAMIDHWPVVFPNPEKAPADGPLAYGGDLTPATLISAYSQGIFPWYSADSPILWWSPDPRCLLFPADFHISSRSLRKIRHSNFTFSTDQAFARVIAACAAPRARQQGTWILPEMQAAYNGLHKLGFAHSVEIWQYGNLVGGLYGVALGHVFFGESMFHRVDEAARAALCCLVSILSVFQYLFLDCQQDTPHMLAMGAKTVERKKFLALVQKAIAFAPSNYWAQKSQPLPVFQAFKS